MFRKTVPQRKPAAGQMEKGASMLMTSQQTAESTEQHVGSLHNPAAQVTPQLASFFLRHGAAFLAGAKLPSNKAPRFGLAGCGRTRRSNQRGANECMNYRCGHDRWCAQPVENLFFRSLLGSHGSISPHCLSVNSFYRFFMTQAQPPSYFAPK
jgi:hypothetical protein